MFLFKKIIMKKYITILVTAVAFFQSCSDERVLDKQPLSQLSDAQVWQSETTVNAYLADLYKRSLFYNDGNGVVHPGHDGSNYMLIANVGGELKNRGNWQSSPKASRHIINETGPHGTMAYFDPIYGIGERVAYLIDKLETESLLSDEFKNEKIAEARFIRAFAYFHGVIRYGGLPIIDYVQDYEDLESLQVPRSSEQEVYDFIASELDKAAEFLSTASDASSGRPTKWAALALKSRAMTYAGSIGEFGTMQLDGLLGVSDPTAYWEAAYETSKQIIEESGHVLYNKNSNKALNFQNLFTDENNEEVIFSEIYDEGLLKTHFFGELAMPGGFNITWGGNFQVFYETVQMFDFADGTSGADIDIERTEGWSIDELFHNRDPRFIASVFYPESDWQGGKVYFHYNTLNRESLPEGMPVKSHPINQSGGRKFEPVGFLLKKRLSEAREEPKGGFDATDYIVFRLGEIYLNMAEAAFHLGKTGEALDAINTIRSRAGMPSRTSLTWDNIMQERQVELFAEDHRYWDLRRWRTAVEILDGKEFTGLKYLYDAETGIYKIKKIPGEKLSRTTNLRRVFQERHYYFPFGVNKLAAVPALAENPGY
jgi:hypothetical protein